MRPLVAAPMILARLSRIVKSWQLQTAKNRLSEVVDAAEEGTPQVITRHGRPTVVVVSIDQYDELVHAKGRFIDLLRRAPRISGGLDVRRSKDRGRKVVR